MGSGGAKETNKLLDESRGRSNALGDIAGGRSQEQYDQTSGLPGEILGNYRDLYSGIGAGGSGGGGGGGGYKAAGFESSSLPFYLEMMNEGGYSEADKANILSYATGPISGMFRGMQRRLQQAGSGRGMPSTGDFSRLTSDQAYQASDAAKGVAGDLAQRILASRFQGAGGVTGVESEKRNFEAKERARAAASRRAGAARGRANEQQDFRNRMGILDAMGSYRPGSDTEYFDRALGANQQAGNLAGSRRDETPGWQKAFTNILPAAAGAAAGSFMPGKKKPYTPPGSISI